MKSYPWCIGNYRPELAICIFECIYKNKCIEETFFRCVPEIKIERTYPSLSNWIKRVYRENKSEHAT